MKRSLLTQVLLLILIPLVAGSVSAAPGFLPPGFDKAAAVQQSHHDILFKIEGVVGTAIGQNSDGDAVVVVYTEHPGVTGVPASLDNVGVVKRVTGRFYALKNPCSGPPASRPPECFGDTEPGVDPTARFDRPVPTGVSTGHPSITAGTIGARVTDGSNVYILSNNHVYADINNATIGDVVIQPGSYDGGVVSSDNIGTLHDYEYLKFDGRDNQIDAAIARSSTTEVANSTPVDGYGVPNTRTVSAEIGQSVQKYGRTTGQTVGTVTELSVIVNVCYEASGPFCIKIARFVDQIGISDGSFSAGGDSGSLIVTNNGNNSPVGLLYAGSSTRTLANPIGLVLTRFGVTVDGTDDVTPPPDTGIVLTASGYKVKGLHKVQLDWTTDNSGNVVIYRDDVTISTTDDGEYIDNIDAKGGAVYSYYLCDALDLSNCSNTETIVF